MTRLGLLVAGACGLALGASFLDSRLAALPWLAVLALLAVAEGRRPRPAFVLGLVTGVTGIALAFAWLVPTFLVFGGFSLPAAMLLFLAPVTWMGLQLALFTGLTAWIGALPFALGPPLTWTTIELLYPSLFPWRLAHTQYRLPILLQSGDLAGPYLLGFAMVWLAAAVVATHLRRRPFGVLVGPTLLLVGLVTYGVWRLDEVGRARMAAPTLRVGIVQGNIGIERKGERSFFRRNLDDYRALSRTIAPEVDLLVWPETVLQRPLTVDVAELAESARPFPGLPKPLLFGGLGLGRAPRRLFNAAFLQTREDRIDHRYDKRILVPFGEYMPFADRFPQLRALSPATGNFSVGTTAAVLALDGTARLGPLICYEDVVPGPARTAVAEGATLLVNLTNDAWYGRTAEPFQHQMLALWRAIEVRRDFVRATNTGLTSVIDAAGHVLGELPIFDAGTLVTEVRLLDRLTPYARVGDAFAWLVTAVFVVVAGARWRTRRRAFRRDPTRPAR